MKSPAVHTRYVIDPRSAAWRAIGASGLWLRVGFVGASVFAVALIMLFDGDANRVSALASIIGGGLVATFAWRHSWVVLTQADVEDAARRETSGLIAFGGGVESAASR